MNKIAGAYTVYVDDTEDAEEAERDYRLAHLREDWPSLTAEQCRELARQLIEAAEYLGRST